MAAKKSMKGIDSERRHRLIDRVLRHVQVDDATGCWLWTARKNNGGYAVMPVRIPGRGHPVPLFVHRVMLELHKGPPPSRDHEAAHDVLCPFRHCVHPEHLRWATPRENSADQRHPSRLHVRQVPPPVHTLEEAFA